jgi:hypothetical protein
MSFDSNIYSEFRRNALLVASPQSQNDISNGTSWFEKFRKTPVAFSLCIALLQGDVNPVERILASQSLCWICKRNKYTKNDYHILIDVILSLQIKDEKISLSNLYICVAHGIIRNILESNGTQSSLLEFCKVYEHKLSSASLLNIFSMIPECLNSKECKIYCGGKLSLLSIEMEVRVTIDLLDNYLRTSLSKIGSLENILSSSRDSMEMIIVVLNVAVNWIEYANENRDSNTPGDRFNDTICQLWIQSYALSCAVAILRTHFDHNELLCVDTNPNTPRLSLVNTCAEVPTDMQ